MSLNNIRYDYILVWGHGVPYLDKIREYIHEHPTFKIKKIIYHKPKSIKKLVNVIYSYDYAPLEHLKAKTKYLLTTPQEVVFLFIENLSPNVDFLGEGLFRHEESLTLKQLKEEIRDLYNPRVNGKRTENHIIHASDNESQTDYILKYLSFNEGIGIFRNKNNFLSVPYYVNKVEKLRIKKVHTNLLICNIVSGEGRYEFSIETKSLIESPQYQGLTKDIQIYEQYINKYLGGPLTEDYYPQRFIDLSRSFEYLSGDYSNSYIIVKREKGS